MWFFLLTALTGLATAQVNSTVSSGLSVTSTSRVPLAASPSAISTSFSTAITVAIDGSGQYTAINAAVSAAQNSGVPTVTVLPGERLFLTHLNIDG